MTEPSNNSLSAPAVLSAQPTPTDDQVEAALDVVPVSDKIAGGVKVRQFLGLTPEQNSIIMRAALTAAFSLSAQAGTVEVECPTCHGRGQLRVGMGAEQTETCSDCGGSGALLPPQPSAGETRDAAEVAILRDYALGNLTRLGVANHLRRAGFNLRYATDKANSLPAEPSAALPGRDDGEVVAMRLETTAENIARDIKEGRFPEQSKPKMVPDVLDAWDRIGADDRLALARKKLSMHELRLIIQHTEAALVSQPHPEGEVVADRASLVWAFRNGASWQQANPDEPIGSIRVAAEEWANAPYPLPAPTLQGAGLIEAAQEIANLLLAGTISHRGSSNHGSYVEISFDKTKESSRLAELLAEFPDAALSPQRGAWK